jgi:hypothetical protein
MQTFRLSYLPLAVVLEQDDDMDEASRRSVPASPVESTDPVSLV